MPSAANFSHSGIASFGSILLADEFKSNNANYEHFNLSLDVESSI